MRLEELDMETDELASNLQEHERKDDLREATLTKHLAKEETKMGVNDAINFFSAPADGGGISAIIRRCSTSIAAVRCCKALALLITRCSR
jgi:hypothetical protein